MKKLIEKIKKWFKEKDVSVLVYPTSTKRIEFKITKKF